MKFNSACAPFASWLILDFCGLNTKVWRQESDVSPLNKENRPIASEKRLHAPRHINQERDPLEIMVEPFLLQIDFVTRIRQRRTATKFAYDHLELPFVATVHS